MLNKLDMTPPLDPTLFWSEDLRPKIDIHTFIYCTLIFYSWDDHLPVKNDWLQLKCSSLPVGVWVVGYGFYQLQQMYGFGLHLEQRKY